MPSHPGVDHRGVNVSARMSYLESRFDLVDSLIEWMHPKRHQNCQDCGESRACANGVCYPCFKKRQDKPPA